MNKLDTLLGEAKDVAIRIEDPLPSSSLLSLQEKRSPVVAIRGDSQGEMSKSRNTGHVSEGYHQHTPSFYLREVTFEIQLHDEKCSVSGEKTS